MLFVFLVNVFNYGSGPTFSYDENFVVETQSDIKTRRHTKILSSDKNNWVVIEKLSRYSRPENVFLKGKMRSIGECIAPLFIIMASSISGLLSSTPEKQTAR